MWQSLYMDQELFINRSQFVMYSNSKSETKFITHGVPKGFNLGPLFFIVFMNDLNFQEHLTFYFLSSLLLTLPSS